MRQQVYLNSRFADGFLPSGALQFKLNPHIAVPSPDYQLTLSLLDASIPLTNYVVTEANNHLELKLWSSADPVPLIQDVDVYFAVGNWPIDALIDRINAHPELYYGTQAAYDEATNLVTLTCPDPNIVIQIGPETTCWRLLGFSPGDTSSDGVLVGRGGVDMSGTQAFYIRSNLKTRNRDPQTRSYGRFLGKVPISRAYNGIEKWTNSTGYSYTIYHSDIAVIEVEILDDDLQPVAFAGGHWDLTLEFDVQDRQTFSHVKPYNEPLEDASGTTAPAD